MVLEPGMILAFSGGNTQDLQRLADRKRISRDLSLLVSVAQTIELHQQKKNLLIDVRPDQVFEKYFIPGSISLPLHTLKTKGFIKFKKIVLVHQGFQYRVMEKECRRLRENGYEVSILEGGINRWHQLGGAVQGNPLALKTINWIEPKVFFAEKDYADLLVFTMHTAQSYIDLNLIPYSVELPKQDIKNTLLKEIRKSSSSSPVILIASQDGRIELKTEKAIDKAGIPNLFFLNGGLNAYQLFLKKQAILNNSIGGSKTSGKGCRPCRWER
jgi:rhodanese-related sulfurtransferase